MSIWQADAVDKTTETIVEALEPKVAAAYEMELSSIETEIQILEYLRRPKPALRRRIEENSANFRRLKQESIRPGNPEGIAQVGSRIDIFSSGYIELSELSMRQADQQQTLSESLERDFDALDNLASINPKGARHAAPAVRFVRIVLPESGISSLLSQPTIYRFGKIIGYVQRIFTPLITE